MPTKEPSQSISVMPLEDDCTQMNLNDQRLTDAFACIDELNTRYAVVKFGGKVQVLDEHGRDVTFVSFADFRNMFNNIKVPVGKYRVALGNHWLDDPGRRQYLNGVVFEPSGGVEPGQYNLWKGFATQPDPSRKCDLILEHLYSVICGGNQEYYDYFLSWLALMVQQPSRLPGVAIILISPQGTGKGLLMEYLGSMFGRHYKHLTGRSHLVGQFSGHLHDAVLVFADELNWGTSKDEAGALKSMITEPTRMVERKFMDAVPVKNCMHLIAASNEEHVVPAEVSDRRFFVLDVSDHQRGNSGYFNALASELEGGGPSGLLAYLLSRDLVGFQPSKFPKTSARVNQQLLSLAPIEAWLEEQLQYGYLADHDENSRSWPEKIEKTVVYKLFCDWYTCRQVKGAIPRLKSFTSTLKKYGIATCRLPADETGFRGQGYEFPSLDSVRFAFSGELEGDVEWEEAA